MQGAKDFAIPVGIGFILALSAFIGRVEGQVSQGPRIDSVVFTPASPVPVGIPIRFTVTASHPEGSPLQYSWEFDDNTPRTAWSGNPAIDHAYAQPGLYAVRVRVQDTLEFEVARIIRLIAVSGTATVPPRSSPLALDTARRHLWVANPDHNSVTVLHTETLTRVKEIPVGGQPQSVALDGHGNAWIPCRKSDEIRIVSADGLSVIRTLPLDYGSAPAAIVFAPDGANAYVSLEGSGKVMRLDAAGMATTGVLSLGATPRALALTPDGKSLLVTRFISSDTSGAIWSVDLETFTRSAAIALPIDRTSFESGTAARGLPNYIAAIAVRPSGKTAWYAAKKDNILRGLVRDGLPLTFESTLRSLLSTLDLRAGTETVSFRIDIDNTSQASALAFSPHGTFVFAAMQGSNSLFVLDAATRHVLVERETGLAPQGIAVDETSGRVFVQDFMGRTVTVFDAKALFATGDTVLNRIAAVSISDREPLPEPVLKGKRVFYNAKDPRMGLDGYTSCAACHLDGGHDGRTWDFSDRGEGLRNTTTLLGKSGMGHGPLHWSANFDEMQDFEHDIRGPFGGKGFMDNGLFGAGTRNSPLGDPKAGSSAELDALAAYVASLTEVRRSPYRMTNGAMKPDALEGEEIFNREDVGCAKCHVPPLYTDSRLPGAVKPLPGPVEVFSGAKSRYTQEGFLLHDVGTLKAASGKRLAGELPGMDTPTLKGLWDTAPYLHDGSAATLMEVLTTANGDDRHGKTSHLASIEKENLVAFMLQLDEADRDGKVGLVRRPPKGFGGKLSLVQSSGGRPRGLILEGPLFGTLPELALHALDGTRLAIFPRTGWRPMVQGSQSLQALQGDQGRFFLPWPAGESVQPGVYLVRAPASGTVFNVKVLINP